jgi:hypothetical protein
VPVEDHLLARMQIHVANATASRSVRHTN